MPANADVLAAGVTRTRMLSGNRGNDAYSRDSSFVLYDSVGASYAAAAGTER